MPKWARISLRFVIGLVLVGVYVYLFGTQNALALMWRYKFRNMPEARETPEQLKDLSISATPHSRLAYCGYQFELPEDDVDEQKSKSRGPASVTAFRSGNQFWFSCFSAKEFINEVRKMSNLEPQRFAQIWGQYAIRSDYNFKRLMLSVAPTRIRPFESRPRAIRDSMLLVMKVIAMPKADSGLFLVQTPRFRGFQFGDPAAHPQRITDELYADDGGVDLIFFQTKSAPAISQPEINRVLQSVRRAANSSQ